MNYSNPANLAVMSCPGGEAFTKQLILHLKNQYRHIFDKTSSEMAKRYKLPVQEVMKQINFINEITNSGLCPHSPDLKLHIPRLEVKANWTLFANGEIKTEILDSIRGKDLFIVQDVENHYPLKFNDGATTKAFSVNDHLMATFVSVDAAVKSGADRITLVLPTYPYSRQHKAKGREAITSSRVGMIFEDLGVDRIVTLDIHSREIGNGFSKLRFENLHASYQFIHALSRIIPLDSADIVVAAPDTGAVDRNKFYATAFKKPLALIYKERDYSKVSKNAEESNIALMKLLGNVEGKIVFMADDMIGTGGTLLKAFRFLKSEKAQKVIAAVSLPLFSGDAIKFFDEAYKENLFYRIIGTNAVYQEELLKREWYQSVNITKLFAQTISRIHQGLPLSHLLDNRKKIIDSLL